uniref:hypothetical protein n=1 Tax=Hormidiella parvula TaxID=2058785 RepID=UPI00286B2E85|nr:hypothetical protein RMD52_pgp031 [Hormidiella parvula]WKT05968.1 hypothetical protein [Hormidiella parvula]
MFMQVPRNPLNRGAVTYCFDAISRLAIPDYVVHIVIFAGATGVCYVINLAVLNVQSPAFQAWLLVHFCLQNTHKRLKQACQSVLSFVSLLMTYSQRACATSTFVLLAIACVSVVYRDCRGRYLAENCAVVSTSLVSDYDLSKKRPTGVDVETNHRVTLVNWASIDITPCAREVSNFLGLALPSSVDGSQRLLLQSESTLVAAELFGTPESWLSLDDFREESLTAAKELEQRLILMDLTADAIGEALSKQAPSIFSTYKSQPKSRSLLATISNSSMDLSIVANNPRAQSNAYDVLFVAPIPLSNQVVHRISWVAAKVSQAMCLQPYYEFIGPIEWPELTCENLSCSEESVTQPQKIFE